MLLTALQVGGGRGHISATLAQAYPKLHFIVQDLYAGDASKGAVPQDLLPRIEFQAHNFFDPQPDLRGSTKKGITYFLRHIIHDWSNKYSSQILKHIVNVMEEVSGLHIKQPISSHQC